MLPVIYGLQFEREKCHGREECPRSPFSYHIHTCYENTHIDTHMQDSKSVMHKLCNIDHWTKGGKKENLMHLALYMSRLVLEVSF